MTNGKPQNGERMELGSHARKEGSMVLFSQSFGITVMKPASLQGLQVEAKQLRVMAGTKGRNHSQPLTKYLSTEAQCQYVLSQHHTDESCRSVSEASCSRMQHNAGQQKIFLEHRGRVQVEVIEMQR